ncbi:MAG: hypothetical protein NXI31_07635 [bacterium]|nr:hypothetical protein [bacterium]
MSDVVVRALPLAEVSERQPEFAAFERQFVYPLGEDSFRIDHGADYLEFFRRLGLPVIVVAERARELLGVCVAVIRAFEGGRLIYFCDLKVRDRGAGGGLAGRLVRACRRAAETIHGASDAPSFGVSMNPATGPNRMQRLAGRLAGGPVTKGAELAIWSLSCDQWAVVADQVVAELGPVGFYDPSGVKDIVMTSTGERMPLLHAQHGPWARCDVGGPRPGQVHMLGLPVADPLTGAIANLVDVQPATAIVLQRGLEDFDWRALLTSEI